MKSEIFFLLLPFLATLANLFMALLFVQSDAQPVLREIPDLLNSQQQRQHSVDSFIVGSDGSFQEEVLLDEDEDDEEDPMLQAMPNTDSFKAYVRADISSFYGLPPGSLKEKHPEFNGQAGKFVNMSPEMLSLWWDGPDGPVYNSDVRPWGSGGTACFPTHEFIFTKRGKPEQVVCRFTVAPGTSVYYCNPFIETDNTDPASGKDDVATVKRNIQELNARDRAYYEAHLYNLEFGHAYKNFTEGQEWLAMYPPEPPRHKIWRADYFGQTHHVRTLETQFMSVPPEEYFDHELSIEEMKARVNDDGSLKFAEYRAPGALNLTIKAISCAPRAFEIRNFLSDVEVEHLLDRVHASKLERSMTGSSGGSVSETRTSSSTWLPRQSDPMLNVIFRRAADVLRMDEALLRERSRDEVFDPMPSNRHKINEDLQVVHYDVGQEYTAHHDFSFPKGPGAHHKVRSINLCMYLNDVPAGGETSFPRWRNAETAKSIDVKPEKGKAMIFYMVNPDGNLDDLTQHAALPVIEGEKYFVNLWISTF